MCKQRSFTSLWTQALTGEAAFLPSSFWFALLTVKKLFEQRGPRSGKDGAFFYVSCDLSLFFPLLILSLWSVDSLAFCLSHYDYLFFFWVDLPFVWLNADDSQPTGGFVSGLKWFNSAAAGDYDGFGLVTSNRWSYGLCVEGGGVSQWLWGCCKRFGVWFVFSCSSLEVCVVNKCVVGQDRKIF